MLFSSLRIEHLFSDNILLTHFVLFLLGVNAH